MYNRSYDTERTAYFTVLLENSNQIVLGCRIYYHLSCQILLLIHSHIQRTIVIKTKASVCLVQLRRTHT
ncbi:hypothetical protein D3C86_2050760 [compost metagenome]